MTTVETERLTLCIPPPPPAALSGHVRALSSVSLLQFVPFIWTVSRPGMIGNACFITRESSVTGRERLPDRYQLSNALHHTRSNMFRHAIRGVDGNNAD